MRNLLSSFVELVHLQSEMNKVFEALQDLHEGDALPEVGFTPPYDILETPDAVLVVVDLPGVCPGSLQVTVQGGVVSLAGDRERSRTKGIIAYHLMERGRGSFLRRFHVEGAINTHGGEATYERGVLTISFPRVPDLRGKSVELPVTVRE